MRVASRLAGARPSATLEIQQAAQRLAASGVDVVDLGVGEPDFPMPKPARDGAIAALEAGRTRYTATAGIAELREAIARRYAERHGGRWTREQVVVSAGAKQGLYNLFMATLDPGDEVVIPTPCWVSFPDQVRLAGGVPVFVPSGPERGFEPDPAALERAIGPRTRAVILNSPANPTGGVIGRAVLADIVEIVRARGLLLVFDETYERFTYDGAEHVSAAAFAGRLAEGLAIVHTFSKTWAMTGLRLGFTVTSPELARVLATFQSHTTSNASSVAQHAALAALTGPDDAVEEMLREYRVRRERVIDALDGVPGVELWRPRGAFYAFPRVAGAMERLGASGSTALATSLLERAHVAVVPGAAFEAEGFLRLSFATSRRALEEGLGRLRRALGARD